MGRALMPERIPNLTWGGARRNRLFRVGCRSLYSLYTGTHRDSGFGRVGDPGSAFKPGRMTESFSNPRRQDETSEP
jgi:hypothetical protein